MTAVHSFDYTAVAELSPTAARSWRSKQRSGFSRRVDPAAEAIRYAMENVEPTLLDGSFLEVGDSLFNGVGIRNFYARDTYPLERRAQSAHGSEDDHE